MNEKYQAYWERNQLVLYMSKIFPSWLEEHPKEDDKWEDDWRNIVFIQFPEGLYSWHIHQSEKHYFSHLHFKDGNSWDGSSTEQKYNSLNKHKKKNHFCSQTYERKNDIIGGTIYNMLCVEEEGKFFLLHDTDYIQLKKSPSSMLEFQDVPYVSFCPFCGEKSDK